MNQYARDFGKRPLAISWANIGYYDSPEGTNPWEKVWGLTRFAIPTGLFLTAGDAIFVTQTQNVLQTANCFGYWMVPLVGLSVAFSSVTYIATNLRGKDDKYNYACGALACGPILHAWKKSTSFTYWSLAALLAAALLKKDSIQKGWEFFPTPTRKYGNYVYDFSLTSEEWPRRPI